MSIKKMFEIPTKPTMDILTGMRAARIVKDSKQYETIGMVKSHADGNYYMIQATVLYDPKTDKK